MTETDGEEKTSAEETEEETEEDPFADIFDDEETKEEDTEEESPKEKKKAPEKKTVQKVTRKVDEIVDERITNAEQRLERRADTTEFLSSDKGKIFVKHIKGFSDKLREAAQKPEYQGIPVTKLPAIILTEAAYAKALEEERKEADREAADSVIGGSTSRSMTPEELQKIDPLTMDQKEFNALKQNALAGKYKIKK